MCCMTRIQPSACDNPEGWDGAVGEGHEGGDISTRMADSCWWQKPTQHCKAIILQLKIKNNAKKRENIWVMGVDPHEWDI